MITSLRLKNFKGANAEHSFARGNLIHGDNFAGKSAIDQAIRCLVLGYIPGVSKTASGIKMFASAYPMEITAHAKIGPVSERDMRVAFEKVKSTLKQTADDTLATIIDEPTRVLFDPSIFFGLADSARISKACELVQSAGMTREDIADAVARVLDVDITPGKAITPSPKRVRYDRWGMEVYRKALTVPDLLTASEEFWKAERKVVNAEKERMQSTVEGVSDLGAADPATLPARDIVEADKKRAQDELRQISDRLAAARALADSIAKDNSRIAELAPVAATIEGLRTEVEALQAKLDGLMDQQATADEASVNARLTFDSAQQSATERAKNRKRLADLRVQADLLPSIQQSIAETEAAVASLRTKVDAAAVASREAEAKAKAIRAEIEKPKPAQPTGELRTDDFETNAVVGQRYLATATVHLVQIGDETVPQILSIEDWKPLLDNAEEAEEAARSEEYEQTQRLAEAEEAAAEASRAVDEVEALLSNELSQLTELRDSLTRATVAKEALAKEPAVEASGEAVDLDALKLAADAAGAKSRALRVDAKAVSDALSAKRTALTKAEAAQNELDALRSKTVTRKEADDAASLAQLSESQKTLTGAIQGHDATLQQISAAEQDRKRIAEAAKRRAEVEADSKLLGKVLDIISQKKTELVSVSIEAPLAIANKLAAGILKGPLVFEEGEIGMRVGDAFVSSRVFSGTESALVVMGLTAGLAAKSALRVLILDEVARLTNANAITLVGNLRSMIADGDLDQFFLIGPTNPLLADACSINEVNVIGL